MSVESKLRELLTMFLSFQYVLALNRCSTTNDENHIGNRLPVSPFAVLNEIGLKMCFRECESYAMCLSVNFSPKMLMCELNRQKKNESLSLVDDKDFIYKEIPDVVDFRDKKCGETSCSYYSKCVRTKLDSYACIEVAVHGLWSGWNTWGDCSVTCGGGVRSRTRSCDNPRPRYGGKACSGHISNTSSCNSHNCTDIRIVSNTSYKGRVEIKYNETWGTVCDDGWDDNDAAVVCRMLGFSGNATAHQRAMFGRGSGQIWLDDVKCNGTESHIFDCQHLPFGKHDCGHHEDASVTCN